MNVSVVCFLASYLVAFVLELSRFVGRSLFSRAVTVGFGVAGLLAHTFYLWNRSQALALPPLMSSTHDWLLVLAWIAVLMYLFLTAVDRKLAIGQFVLPLVLLLIGSAYLVSDQPNLLVKDDPTLVQTARRGWAMLHATLLVFGAAGVLAGLTVGAMYLVQHRRLKHKQTSAPGLMLPSLEKLARMNWWTVVVSVPLLSLGMIIGVVLGLTATETEFSFRDPVVIVDSVAWVLMVVFFVWLLKTRRPAARQVAWLTVWAFGFLLVTLIGVQILTGGGLLSVDSWHALLPGAPAADAASRGLLAAGAVR